MDLQLLELIESYQKHVEEACNLFRTNLGVKGSILAAWRRFPIEGYGGTEIPTIPREGMLDSQRDITYSFHGIGCCVTFSSLVVDFDFGPQGRFDGFDAWRLYLYADTSSLFTEYANKDLIQASLDSLAKSRKIKKSDATMDKHLYYLLTNKHHENWTVKLKSWFLKDRNH